MKSIRRLTVLAALVGLSTSAIAQPMGSSPLMHRPAFLDDLFRPALIMRHQEHIGLTDAQRYAITQEMRETQQNVIARQWEFEAESEKLSELVAQDKIDEAQALQQADRLMHIEGQIKRLHLRMLIRIKNRLTAEQQAKLRALRLRSPRGRRRHHRTRPENQPSYEAAPRSQLTPQSR